MRRRYVYERRGRMYMGKELVVGWLAEWVRAKGHAVRSQVTAASGAVSLMQMQQSAKRQYQVQNHDWRDCLGVWTAPGYRYVKWPADRFRHILYPIPGRVSFHEVRDDAESLLQCKLPGLGEWFRS